VVIEPEAPLAEALRARLRSDNFSVAVCASPAKALSVYTRLQPDLLLLDVDGADQAAWSLVKQIRASDAVPILIISERSDQNDIVAALERGADDYVTKPLPMDELLARIRVALRRHQQPEQTTNHVVRVGELEIDVGRRRVLRAGQVVRLTPREYALLVQFAMHVDKLLTERMLVEWVWGSERPASSHLLHVYIARLRRKIEANPLVPSSLITERRAGYRLTSADAPSKR